MAFICPECSTSKSLKIGLKIELPPDSRSDEITLQVVKCTKCGFEGIAVYEESRRGAMGSESFDHSGYRVNVDDLKDLKVMIRQCPEPRNRRCRCPVHRKLRRTDSSGRWNGLGNIVLIGRFPLKC